MVKQTLILIFLVFYISSISAFCTTQGYIFDENKNLINATKVNVICKRLEGDLVSQITGYGGYGFPFGNWYDDCSYCDQGIEVLVFNDNLNFYGEVSNESCNSIQISKCHSNVYLNKVEEEVSHHENYNLVPDFGSSVENPKPMPKSDESPQTKINGIIDEPKSNYTVYYIVLGIIGFILIYIGLKSGKK